MKKSLLKNYSLFILIVFIINNVLLSSIKVSGIVYDFIMIILIILNILVLIIYQKKIKYKEISIIGLILLLMFSKNTYYFLFNILSIILLIIPEFKTNQTIKFIAVLMILIIVLLNPVMLVIIIVSIEQLSDIYEDTHYRCDNYNVYAYSSGAFDKFHYSIGKYYEIINIDGIINIIYDERNEKTKKEYDSFIEKNNCNLVGDKNEFK